MDKDKALEVAIAGIEKQFGKGAITKLGDREHQQIDVISTGTLSIDMALGIGGLPRGRITEVFGSESSGKTTFALHVIAEAQKHGGIAAFIDTEHALDPIYAQALGVKVEDLYIAQPATAEEALEIVDSLVRSGSIDIIVIDSVAAMVPRAELEGEMGQSHMGVQARLMSQALRKLTGNISKSNCCAIFVNQLRQKIGVIYGSPDVTTGGIALKFYASVRIDIRKIENIKDGTDIAGARVRVKIVKNKLAAPFKQAEVEILFGEGISKEAALIDAALNNDILTKSGSWYTYSGEQIGQGRENVRQYLVENPGIAVKMEQEVKGLVVVDDRKLEDGDS